MKKINLFILFFIILFLILIYIYLNTAKNNEEKLSKFETLPIENISVAPHQGKYNFQINVPGYEEFIVLPINTDSDENQFVKFVDDEGISGIVVLINKMILKDREYIFAPFVYNGGGTGNFVYLGIFDNNGQRHLDSIFIGDRILLDKIYIENNVAVIEYFTRRDDEPFSSPPTLKSTLRKEFNQNGFVE